jgi:anti-sigma regulatory factor (Ser/Thr protein kinase)
MASGVESKAGSVHVRFEAVPESVREARVRVRSWCGQAGVDCCMRDDLLLAVTEAAANVVRHAYPEEDGGMFSLDLRREAGDVVVEIRDEGVGMEAAVAAPGGGLGLQIIRRLFPGVTFREADPGTRVIIRGCAG